MPHLECTQPWTLSNWLCFFVVPVVAIVMRSDSLPMLTCWIFGEIWSRSVPNGPIVRQRRRKHFRRRRQLESVPDSVGDAVDERTFSKVVRAGATVESNRQQRRSRAWLNDNVSVSKIVAEDK